MSSVAIHPPKTPVTSGFNRGTAKNTLPNVCKMPGPPAPFVPTPLPNIAKSNLSPKGFSKNVKIEGKTVAIFGASFKSLGDIASKGTGGGLISMNAHGPTKFIVPGSLTVHIEGKPVHLLGDMLLNNVGAAGMPPNTGATMGGADLPDNKVKSKEDLECGEVGTYSELKKKNAAGPGFERDHVPSCAALKQRAEVVARELGHKVTPEVSKCLKNKTRSRGIAVAIPRQVHRSFSLTYGSKNKALYGADGASADSLEKTKTRDTDAVRENLPEDCKKAYDDAVKRIREEPTEEMIEEVVDECCP